MWKMNFDSASKRNPRPSSDGCIIKGSLGNLVKVTSKGLKPGTNNKAEAKFLLLGLHLVKSCNIDNFLIEGDSMIIVLCIKKKAFD